jgi:hypothetical protein
MIHKEYDTKCAPSKKYTDGSCFTIDVLKKIALNYNNKNTKNKIDLNLTKPELVNELEKRLADKCSDQTCWIRLDIVKELENPDIVHNTFKPKGPPGKYEWLTTTHINAVINQYHTVYKDFLFLGAVPVDFDELPILGIHNLNFDTLKSNGKTKIGLIINLDEHWKDGSHWVALYNDIMKNQIYYFDSLGKEPPKRIRKFINKMTKYLYSKKYNRNLPINDVISDLKKMHTSKINKNTKVHLNNLLNGQFDIKYNHIQHQFEDSECGVYSMNFILNLVKGNSFEYVTKNIKSDEEMNGMRKEFFRNVN